MIPINLVRIDLNHLDFLFIIKSPFIKGYNYFINSGLNHDILQLISFVKNLYILQMKDFRPKCSIYTLERGDC